MASPQPENGASPSGEEEDFGYGHFPDRRAKPKPKLIFNQAFTHNGRCQGMMKVALDTNPYAKLLLDAMKNSGCTVYRDRHFSCENCDRRVSGGFDSLTSQIVLCQNNIRRQSQMNRVVVHELIHAFDHCRAQVDWFHNMKHLACSEIRAANLSGDCSLLNEISRLKFGLRQHHQTCVRDRAVRSMLSVRKISKDIAEKVVDEVFDSCFNDQEPFGRVPYSTSEAKYVYRDFQNRGRYYTNL